nr:hypothetical protein [uncultured Pseudomonas sp.]
MNYRHLLVQSIAACAPLLLSLPAAADWPEGAKNQFTEECIASAQGSHSQAQLRAYCECAATQVSSEFSEAELRELGQQASPDPALRQRLVDASSSCETHLQQ